MAGLGHPRNPKSAPRPIYQRLDPRSVIYVPAPEEPEEELPYDELCWGGGSGSGGDICQNYEEDTDDEEPEDDCARIRGYAHKSLRDEFLAIHGCEEDDPAEIQHFDEVSRITQNWKIMDSGNETLYAIDQRINSIIFQKRDQEKKEDGEEGGPGTSPDVIIQYPPKHPCSTAKSKPPIQPEEEGAPAPPPALPNKIQFNYMHPPLGEPVGGEGDTGGGPPPNDPPPAGTPPA